MKTIYQDLIPKELLDESSFQTKTTQNLHMGWASGKNNYPENKLLLISINFTPKTSHSCLQKWYTGFSRYTQKGVATKMDPAPRNPRNSMRVS